MKAQDLQPGRTRRSPQRGFAAIVAMVFLAICAALAVGLFAQAQSSTAVTGNQLRTARAQSAMESGVQFFQYQTNQAMATVTSPLTAATMAKWLGGTSGFADKLAALMDGKNGVEADDIYYGTMNGRTGVQTPWISMGPNTNASFMASICGDAAGTGLVMFVTGRCVDPTDASQTVTRTARMAFSVTPQSAGGPMPYPLFAKGGIPNWDGVSPDGDMKVKETAGKTKPVDLEGGGKGTALIYEGMTAPTGPVPFPDNDKVITSAASLGLTERTEAKSATISGTNGNFTIPANKDYKLTGTINGVVYVKWPNTITLTGDITINGTIIVERKGGKGDNSKIVLERTGTVSRPMDAANAEIMKLPAFPGQADLKWWSIIAPDANLEMPNGTSHGTMKQFEGSIHCRDCSRTGGGDKAGFEILKGGLLAEGTISFNSNSSAYKIDPDTTGVSGGTPKPGKSEMAWGTYEELMN